MTKKILLPLDGTEASETVLPKLDSLVFKELRRSDIEITLLQVIPIVNYNVLTTDESAQLPYTDDDKKELIQEANDYLVTVAETLQKKGFKTGTVVKIGPAAEEIIKVAHEIDATLIAMSTSGRSGLMRWAMGSVTAKVIKLAGKIPVLAFNAKENMGGSSIIPLNSLQSLINHS